MSSNAHEANRTPAPHPTEDPTGLAPLPSNMPQTHVTHIDSPIQERKVSFFRKSKKIIVLFHFYFSAVTDKAVRDLTKIL